MGVLAVTVARRLQTAETLWYETKRQWINLFVFILAKKKKTSNNSMLRQCALGVLDTRSRRPRRWMCMHACSTFACFRRSSLCDLFSRLFEKYIVQCTFRFGWIKFNLKCGFPVRSHLCAVIASKHLEFAYTHSQHSRVREKRRQKKNTEHLPIFDHWRYIYLFYTEHRNNCWRVSAWAMFFIRTNSFACGACGFFFSLPLFDSVDSNVLLFN